MTWRRVTTWVHFSDRHFTPPFSMVGLAASTPPAYSDEKRVPMKLHSLALKFGAAGLVSVLLLLSPSVHAQKLELKLVASDLTAPIHLEELPDGTGRFLVVQQDGLVKLMAADGQVQSEPVMDLRSRMLPVANDFEERGLLGFALHPQFAKNGRFFVSYSSPLRDTAPQNWNYTRRVSEFTAKIGNTVSVDLQTERVLIALDWPSRKHNGGAMAFGPDGMLYIGMGDSGASHGIGKSVIW
ncbi:MAG: hypothetical protein EB110_07050, partial [Betaproteobacteria bacterium]|nr:hypothetical protein [Betaproteobacteria bacterium]